MSLRRLQTNFTGGELDEHIGGRTDLALYTNGVRRLRNLRPLPGGGVRRRAGLAWAATVPNAVYQHEEWIFNYQQLYQLLFSAGKVRIHGAITGTFFQEITGCPWTLPMIRYLSVYCQGDFAFIAHPDLKPQRIKRTGATTFVLEDFVFDRTLSGAEHPVWQPYHRYVANDLPIKVTQVSGYTDNEGWAPGAVATLSTAGGTGWAGYDFFVAGHVGTFLQIGNGAQWEITAVAGPRTATATLRSHDFRIRLLENAVSITQTGPQAIFHDPFHDFAVGSAVSTHDVLPFSLATYAELNGVHNVAAFDASNWRIPLAGPGPYPPGTGGGPNMTYWAPSMQTVEWKEQMYSAVRGWPHCVGSFQRRLILGGGRDAPNRLNFSRVDAPFNFDVGTGLDDDAIQIGISSRRTPTVLDLVDSTHLQVFTSEGEFFVPTVEDQASLTPTSIAVRSQTFFGIKPGLPVLDFDGATLFISKNGGHLRQYVYAEGGYTATDLSFVSHHLLTNPAWLSVQMENPEQGAATALVVNADGTLASLTMMRSEKIAAWALYTSSGSFKSACAIDSNAFFLVERTVGGGAVTWLEKLDRSRMLDGSGMGVYLRRDGQAWVWGGFARFANSYIDLVVDGTADIGPHLVSGTGEVTIMSRAETLEGGLGFMPEVETLPPEMVLADGPSPGEPRRVVSATLRVKDTVGLRVRSNRVVSTSGHHDLGLPAPLYTGNVHVPLLGWNTEGRVNIGQYGNCPFTLLSLNLELEF